MTGQSGRSYVLTATQQNALAGALEALATEERLEQEHAQAKTRKNAAVARALARGVPAPVLAGHFRVTVTRIYQMRDNTR
jgi:hypothetical protein